MGVFEDAQGIAQQIWGDQDGTIGVEPNSHSQGAASETGPEPEHLSLRTNRADCTGGIPRGGIAGGILSQLIQQAEDQLREAEECISWYERAKEKAQRQVENLRQLQQLAEQETEAE